MQACFAAQVIYIDNFAAVSVLEEGAKAALDTMLMRLQQAGILAGRGRRPRMVPGCPFENTEKSFGFRSFLTFWAAQGPGRREMPLYTGRRWAPAPVCAGPGCVVGAA